MEYEYTIYDLADMLADEIEESGKSRWSAKDVKEFFLFEGIDLSLDEIIQVWNACSSPVCACELLGCDAVMAADDLDLKSVTIYFGDGNSAASRGWEAENDYEISGSASSAQLAFAAGYFVDCLDDNFTDEDIISCIEDYGESVDADWKDELSSRDIGGGAPLVYKIVFDGNEIYYDAYLEEEVKSYAYDEDEYEDEDDDDGSY